MLQFSYETCLVRDILSSLPTFTCSARIPATPHDEREKGARFLTLVAGASIHGGPKQPKETASVSAAFGRIQEIQEVQFSVATVVVPLLLGMHQASKAHPKSPDNVERLHAADLPAITRQIMNSTYILH